MNTKSYGKHDLITSPKVSLELVETHSVVQLQFFLMAQKLLENQVPLTLVGPDMLQVLLGCDYQFLKTSPEQDHVLNIHAACLTNTKGTPIICYTDKPTKQQTEHEQHNFRMPFTCSKSEQLSLILTTTEHHALHVLKCCSEVLLFQPLPNGAFQNRVRS